MERNRIKYFCIAVAFFVLGYLSRIPDVMIWRKFSFLLLSAGMFFIFAIQFKKAASWLLVIINLIVCCGIHILRLMHIEFYNNIYDSPVGSFILGGPFNIDMFIYIFLGTLAGASLELALRPFNKIGMG